MPYTDKNEKKESSKRYHQMNREELTTYAKNYREQNKEILRKKKRDYYIKNKKILNQKSAEYAKKFPDNAKNSLLKFNYGITLIRYKQIQEDQNFSCKICGVKEKLVVDHCHLTNLVRGLLCTNCNKGLGFFKDNKKSLLKAVKYIQENEEKMEKIIETIKGKLSN